MWWNYPYGGCGGWDNDCCGGWGNNCCGGWGNNCGGGWGYPLFGGSWGGNWQRRRFR